MTFKVITDGETKQTLVAIGEITEDMRKGIRHGFEELGSNMVRTAENQALNEPKFGRTYKLARDGVRRLHRASAPGQSPAIDTGEYFEAFDYEARGWTELEFGNDAPHAEFLEDGTDNMEPRPGVINAANASVRNSRSYMATKINQSLKL